MDAENISPREARRNFWHFVVGICLIAQVWRPPEILAVLK